MKGKKMILAIFVMTLTVLVMAIGVGIKEKKEATNAEITDLLNREVLPETENALSQNYHEPFEKANWITVEKVERTTVEDAEGNAKTTYQTYVVSDLDLKNQKESTEDYVSSISSDGLDDSLVERVSFEEGFGFSYEKLNGYEILCKLMEVNGFDGNLHQVEYDSETYEMTKQNLYVLKEDCSVIKEMLDGISYDELLEANVFYQTLKTDEQVVIPDCIIAVVQYRIGEEIYTRNCFLQVSINHWEEMEVGDDIKKNI